jgi:signal transduction histidine kinase/heme-degrading monooxygenase HmoA
MIQAISRFRVRNGLEAEVRDAFFNRTHLVDQVPGFLGMEVFTDTDDPAIFYLLTRWTDAASFRHWHASDAHRLSHRGIPRGIKLDPSFTQVVILDRLYDSVQPPNLTEFTADAAPLLARHLASTQTVHLVMAATDGSIRGCNSAIATLLKIPSERLVGKSLWQFLPDADAASLQRRAQSAGLGSKDRFFINVVDAQNVPFTLECLLDVQPDGFSLIGEAPRKQDDAFQEEMLRLNNELAVLTRENVRKSRALEKALADLKDAQARLVHQEKMASLGQLTAGIAHEINNPIAFVGNNQSTLQRDFEHLLALINVVGDCLSELAAGCPAVADQIIRKAAEIDLPFLARSVPKKIADNLDGLERVRRIVLDLRNFSRLDEGEVKCCDVAEGIRSGLKFISTVLDQYGVTVETHFPPLPPLLCSPGPLNQAVSNVIVNAVQASRPGETVKVSTAQESGCYVISVQDQGCGIAPEHLTRVFDPFFTTKPVGTGTGLGLSIAHQVIQMHQGDIQITSEIGKGTTIRLSLPLQPATDGDPAAISNAENMP